MGKISHDDMDTIVKFIKEKLKKRFTDDNIDELKKYFCIDINNAKNKVYWSFNIEFKRGQDQFREGIISKDDYEEVMKSSDYTFSFGEISKHCYLDVEMKEIHFSTDEKDVMEFLESKRDDADLMQYFEDFD